MRLNTLNFHAKLGITGFLITVLIGVISAAILIGLLYSGHDRGFRLPEMDKVKAKYSKSILVGSMKTSMYRYVTTDEDIEIIAKWIKDGAKEDDYFRDEVMYIIEADCQKCHSRTATMTGAIPSMPLSNYDDIRKYTEKGYSWTLMAKSAHTHLLGIGVFMVLVSLLMAFSSYQSWIKTSLLTIAWVSLWVDISSWWLAKFSDLFAYLLTIFGTFEVGAISVMSGLCLIDIWIKIPACFQEQSKSGKDMSE